MPVNHFKLYYAHLITNTRFVKSHTWYILHWEQEKCYICLKAYEIMPFWLQMICPSPPLSHCLPRCHMLFSNSHMSSLSVSTTLVSHTALCQLSLQTIHWQYSSPSSTFLALNLACESPTLLLHTKITYQVSATNLFMLKDKVEFFQSERLIM